jgi:hypothetical protein
MPEWVLSSAEIMASDLRNIKLQQLIHHMPYLKVLIVEYF